MVLPGVVSLSPGPAPGRAASGRGRRPRPGGPCGGGGTVGGAGLCVAGRRPGRPRIPPGRDRHAARLPRRAGGARARSRQGLRRRQGHGAEHGRRRSDDRRPRRDRPATLGVPQSALGLGLRDLEGRAGAGPAWPPARRRQLGLPLRGAADLAGTDGSGGDDPARLGRAPDRPGPSDGSWTLPAALRLGCARPLAGRG